MTDLRSVRKQAWATRRRTYGPKGHASSYRLFLAGEARDRDVLLSQLYAARLLIGNGDTAAGIAELNKAIRWVRKGTRQGV